MKKKKKKKMKSTKTINKYSQPDLNQGCPEWKAGVLTTTLMVLADRVNYIYPYREESSIYGSLCQVQICKQKVLINQTP